MFSVIFYAHLLASLLLFRSLIQVAASSIHHNITIVHQYIIPMPPKKKHQIRITRAGGERAKGPTGEGTSAEPQLGETSARSTRGSSTMPTQMKVVTMPARKGKGSKGGGKDSSKKSNVMSNLKTPPEMLIAAHSPIVGTVVDLSTTPTTKGVMELDSPSAGLVARVPAAAKSRTRSEQQDKSVRKQALTELLQFQKMYKDAQRADKKYMSIASSSSEEDSDEDFKCLPDYPYDPDMFNSEEDELEDPMYYRDTSERGKGAVGRKLVTGGPVKPNTDGLSEVEAEKLIMKWRKERKKYTDRLALIKRKGLSKADVQGYDTSDEFTGVLVEKLRLQTQVEDTPMMVGHTYPTKEIVLLRIAEEANVSGCMISFVRSDTQRVNATGHRDGHKFCIKVVYNNAHAWKVEVCNTYPEKLVDDKLVDDNNKVETNVSEVGGEVGDPDDHSVSDPKDNDNEHCVDDDYGDDNESSDGMNDGE